MEKSKRTYLQNTRLQKSKLALIKKHLKYDLILSLPRKFMNKILSNLKNNYLYDQSFKLIDISLNQERLKLILKTYLFGIIHF